MTTPEREMWEAFEQSQREMFGFWCGPFKYREQLGSYEDQSVDKLWRTFKAATALAERRMIERCAKVCAEVLIQMHKDMEIPPIAEEYLSSYRHRLVAAIYALQLGVEEKGK